MEDKKCSLYAIRIINNINFNEVYKNIINFCLNPDNLPNIEKELNSKNIDFDFYKNNLEKFIMPIPTGKTVIDDKHYVVDKTLFKYFHVVTNCAVLQELSNYKAELKALSQEVNFDYGSSLLIFQGYFYTELRKTIGKNIRHRVINGIVDVKGYESKQAFIISCIKSSMLNSCLSGLQDNLVL